MMTPTIPMYFVKIMHYEVVKCVKCGSISVVKTPLYKPIHTYPLVSFYEESSSDYDDIPIGEEEDCICFPCDTTYEEFGFQNKQKCGETSPNDSYNCIDGICENCIKENNITIVFSKDNPITNYCEAYERLESIRPHVFHAKKYNLLRELSEEFLRDINPDAYNSIICGNSPETLKEKEALAQKYVELSIKKVVEHVEVCMGTYDFYAKAKSELDRKTKEALEFLQNAGPRVYRCKKIKYCSDTEWSKAKHCPFFPDAVVSDCEFYKLEERYNTKKNLNKIKDRNTAGVFAGFEKEFDELFYTLASKIAKVHNWH